MDDKHTFERIREDVEERQKNILWEEARRGGGSVDAFLWNGDPHAKPIQRAGLIVFCLFWLFLSMMAALGLFRMSFDDGWEVVFFMMLGIGLSALLISLRLFRNAFRRGGASKRAKHSEE